MFGHISGGMALLIVGLLAQFKVLDISTYVVCSSSGEFRRLVNRWEQLSYILIVRQRFSKCYLWMVISILKKTHLLYAVHLLFFSFFFNPEVIMIARQCQFILTPNICVQFLFLVSNQFLKFCKREFNSIHFL